MSLLEQTEVHCPYCDARIAVELEPDLEGQCFIEDCPVCCQAIDFAMNANADGTWQLVAHREDD